MTKKEFFNGIDARFMETETLLLTVTMRPNQTRKDYVYVYQHISNTNSESANARKETMFQVFCEKYDGRIQDVVFVQD